MAFIYWRLGHLTRSDRRPLQAFVVHRYDQVFDVDRTGWDQGIRPGDALETLKWRYPEAVWVPWQAADYAETDQALRDWVASKAASYHYAAIQQGWWEWPRWTRSAFEALMAEVVPRWAGRFEAGVARHPGMAAWICAEGDRLALPGWSNPFGKTYVLSKDQEERLWPRLPLRYLENIPSGRRRQWRQRGWRTLGEVPGLMQEIRQYSWPQADPSSRQTPIVIERWLEGASWQGLAELVSDIGDELVRQCQMQELGVSGLHLLWLSEEGPETRQRTWPIVASQPVQIKARVLSLLRQPPHAPPEKVRLEAYCGRPVMGQMDWWGGRGRPLRTDLAGMTKDWSVSRRERLLQFWDVWRMPVVRP